MKLLDRDLETNGRTWLDPRGLDKLMQTGPYNAAAFLIVGPTVIATTGPLVEHLDLLTLAGMDYGQDQWTHDTEFFSPHFSRGTIGLLRGNAGASGVAIEFDVPDRFPLRRQFDGMMVPDVPAKSIDLLEAHVREHAGMRAAFPRGMRLRVHFRNYRSEINAAGWIYEEHVFRNYDDQRALFSDLCSPNASQGSS
jgi:hypothetical protein